MTSSSSARNTGDFNIGCKVRVTDQTLDFSHVGVISYVHPDGTVDVMYDGKELIEDLHVAADRLSPLLSFELEDLVCDQAEELKNRGNILFGLKDYTEASKSYLCAVAKLENQRPLSIGSEVLVCRPEDEEFHHGYLASFIDSTGNIEIVLDGKLDCVASRQSIVALSIPSTQDLHRAIYLNLARCSLKRGHRGWAVRYASIALAISQLLLDTENIDPTVAIKKLADCLYFRSKTLISAGRPNRAAKVITIT
jgi:hypothetical protein